MMCDVPRNEWDIGLHRLYIVLNINHIDKTHWYTTSIKRINKTPCWMYATRLLPAVQYSHYVDQVLVKKLTIKQVYDFMIQGTCFPANLLLYDETTEYLLYLPQNITINNNTIHDTNHIQFACRPSFRLQSRHHGIDGISRELRYHGEGY